MAGQPLFAPDPIDFFDPTPYAALEYQGHMVIGAIWFLAAIAAFVARKGSNFHIRAGQICIAAVLLTCVSAVVMLTVEFVPPLALNAVTASYAVITAWLALQPGTRRVRFAEIGLSLLEIVALAIFLTIAFANIRAGGVPFFAPMTVGVVPVILLLGDLHFHLRQSARARLRIARHLARMVWAFAIVLRAPLVEFETAGFYDVFDPLLVVGPVILGFAMLLYFQRRYGSLRRSGAVRRTPGDESFDRSIRNI